MLLTAVVWDRQIWNDINFGESEADKDHTLLELERECLEVRQASIVCCSQRSWTCHSHGWTPPSGFWDYCWHGNILICGLLMYVRLWNTLKDIWSILYNIVFWDSLDFVMWFFRACVVVVCIEMIRNKSYNIVLWNIISSRLCNVVFQASYITLVSIKGHKGHWKTDTFFKN